MTYVTVDIDTNDVLCEISDETIREEYINRFGGETTEDMMKLREIFQMLRTNKKEQACEAMHVYLCEKLGRVV